MASVPHNYMLGAFVNGGIAGDDAARLLRARSDLAALDADAVAQEQERVLAPTRRDDGLTPFEMEYKTRRMVNDYLQPPKVTRKMEIGMQRFAEVREDLGAMVARDPHELMRALEVHSILDCAEMAAAASLFRTESRWGLIITASIIPERDQDELVLPQRAAHAGRRHGLHASGRSNPISCRSPRSRRELTTGCGVRTANAA